MCRRRRRRGGSGQVRGEAPEPRRRRRGPAGGAEVRLGASPTRRKCKTPQEIEGFDPFPPPQSADESHHPIISQPHCISCSKRYVASAQRPLTKLRAALRPSHAPPNAHQRAKRAAWARRHTTIPPGATPSPTASAGSAARRYGRVSLRSIGAAPEAPKQSGRAPIGSPSDRNSLRSTRARPGGAAPLARRPRPGGLPSHSGSSHPPCPSPHTLQPPLPVPAPRYPARGQARARERRRESPGAAAAGGGGDPMRPGGGRIPRHG